MRIFITGTDTDAGKTYVTTLLLEALRAAGVQAAGFKPFCCGSRQDSVALLNASTDGLTLDQINPVWLKTSASPMTAALIENRELDISAVKDAYHDLTERVETILVEGAGGWEVPLSAGYTTADFAAELGLPILIVVNNRLGALNHAILTVKNIQSRGLIVAGLVLNYAAAERDAASISNAMILEQMVTVPVLGEVMHGETDGSDLLAALQETQNQPQNSTQEWSGF